MLRQSVRGLILDQDDSVLLVRFEWPGGPDGGFWANPGGGIEPGESRLDALRRELAEEVGLDVPALGEEVWTKTAYFPMADWDGQVDHVHLLRVSRFEPCPGLSAEALAAEHVHEVRWWSLEELAHSTATFSPRALPSLLAELLTGGVPASPLVLEGF
nr:NUDIX domain-containing protein [Propionicimonas sp.]